MPHRIIGAAALNPQFDCLQENVRDLGPLGGWLLISTFYYGLEDSVSQNPNTDSSPGVRGSSI